LIEGNIDWMYSLKQYGKMSGLAASQKAAWDSFASLYRVLGDSVQEAECRQHSTVTARAVLNTFTSDHSPMLRMPPKGEATMLHKERFAIDGNLWAILHGIVEADRAAGILQEIRNTFWTEYGPLNIWPIFTDEDGIWWSQTETRSKDILSWRHNNNIWPYMGSFEVLARFYSGDLTNGLELMKRMAKAHLDQGHHTIWEMMYPDGDLPFGYESEILSNSHCWGSVGSYGLQAYIGGIRPASIGFKDVIIRPQPGPLDWVHVKVPTPYGTIEVEAEKNRKGLQVKKTIPKGIREVTA
jgi:hypothetical protein